MSDSLLHETNINEEEILNDESDEVCGKDDVCELNDCDEEGEESCDEEELTIQLNQQNDNIDDVEEQESLVLHSFTHDNFDLYLLTLFSLKSDCTTLFSNIVNAISLNQHETRNKLKYLKTFMHTVGVNTVRVRNLNSLIVSNWLSYNVYHLDIQLENTHSLQKDNETRERLKHPQVVEFLKGKKFDLSDLERDVQSLCVFISKLL